MGAPLYSKVTAWSKSHGRGVRETDLLQEKKNSHTIGKPHSRRTRRSAKQASTAREKGKKDTHILFRRAAGATHGRQDPAEWFRSTAPPSLPPSLSPSPPGTIRLEKLAYTTLQHIYIHPWIYMYSMKKADRRDRKRCRILQFQSAASDLP